MKLTYLFIAGAISALIILAACTPQPDEQGVSPASEKTIYLGPALVDCVGVAPQKCMQVKESPESEYTLLYNQIEGFDFEEGYEYVLIVREEMIENPPADAPDRTWVLVSVKSKTPVAASTVDLPAQTYILDWYLDEKGEKMSVLPGTQITMQIEQDRIGGSAGCNSYSAQFELDGDQVSISEPVSTMMACPELVMQQESAYLAALGKAATVSVGDEMLTFTDAQGAIILSYHTAVPLSLMGTLWDLVAYNNGKGGVVTVLVGTSPNALFSADGSLSGSAGCNNYNATYQLDGNQLTIGPAAATRMYCAEPAGVMEQEAQYLATLGMVRSYKIQLDRLILSGEGDTRVAEYVANPLVNTTWNLVEIQYSDDTTKVPADPSQYNVIYQPDGTLNVKADCNNASGSYTVSGSGLTIRLGPTTRAMCPPESLSEEYLQNLSIASSYQIVDGDLYIAMQMDTGIMKFTPAR